MGNKAVKWKIVVCFRFIFLGKALNIEFIVVA